MGRISSHILWIALAIIGAYALGFVALSRGEAISAVWIVVAAVCIYLVAYRYYSLYISKYVMGLDATRMTPAWRHNDGLDYVPTNKYVLYGHHFAAIAGAGPLVGPVLAAQMGYLPGTLWIIIGVVFCGAVQDFMILFVSMRRDGRSLGDLVKMEFGYFPGIVALFGCLMIMIIILGVLAMVVVNALADSSWGTFTVMATIPIALAMGLYTRYIRPGKIAEVSIGGFILLMTAILVGEPISKNPELSQYFHFSKENLAWIIVGYGFVAAVLPVWLLLAPRDYLSTFLKIGAIVALALGVIYVNPTLQMPAITEYASTGAGKVWGGSMFPFLFITIACGAVSGFHALISSGTTPKMLENETHARFVGFGGMLMESFVAVMAMVAASVIHPGVYFAMNTASFNGVDPVIVAQTISDWNVAFSVTADTLTQLAKDVGEETIIAKAGGAPTLAVGMAYILHLAMPWGDGMMAFWYHFAILFEALFILTAVDAGTRSGRFMIQDLLGTFVPVLKRTDNIGSNLIGTALCVGAWGYLLLAGVRDPLGGIFSMWPLFGIANQMLAGAALVLCTVVIFKMKRQKHAWVTILPTIWLLSCTMVAGYQKAFSSDPRVASFLSMGRKFSQQASELITSAAGSPTAEVAKQIAKLQQTSFNNYLNMTLTVTCMTVVLILLVCGIMEIFKAWNATSPTVQEVPYEPMPEGAKATS